MNQIVRDALTIQRYIDSCQNQKHINLCDKILWQFRKKYSNETDLFGFERIDYTGYFRDLSRDLRFKGVWRHLNER